MEQLVLLVFLVLKLCQLRVILQLAQKRSVEPEPANHLVVAAPTQVHDLYKNIAAEHKILLLEREENIVAGKSLNNISFRILI